jgi:hypothetical protein
MKFIKYAVQAGSSSKKGIDTFDGTSMKVNEHGFVEIWGGEPGYEKLVAVTQCQVNESICAVGKEDPIEPLNKKFDRVRRKGSHDAVRASRTDMVALAADKESKKAGRRLDGTNVQ